LRRAAVVAILLLLLPSLAPPSRAQSPDIDAAWRKMFRRDIDPPAPPDNPLSRDKVMLGARLFADTRLSGAGNRSCASCHQRERAFTDGRRRALALSGASLHRNTPSLRNLAWSKQYFWDGRAASLEATVRTPIDDVEELGGDWPTILRKLSDDAELVGGFRLAFPDEPLPSQASVLKALASYVRSLVSPGTRFDAWIEGDPQALRPAEIRGFRLFTGRAACVLCHVGWRFTDDRFHDIGLPGGDLGRGALPGGTPGLRAFKTPSLRELTLTAPYMHDGSLVTLSAVVRHYGGDFVIRPSLSTLMNRGLHFSARERSDLIAFLRALSGDDKPFR
jgi:cytochrome c peroxidase